MKDWTKKMFIDHADFFLKLLDQRREQTENLVNGMVKVLSDYGITSGNVLDLCCGNGRISIHFAKKGFKAVGVDFSKVFLEDAKRKAKAHEVADKVTFLQGDVRKLNKVIGKVSQPFDVVVSAWTSIGYFSQKEDLNMFKQARTLSREGAILLISETMHSDFLSLKFTPTGYMEIDDMVILDSRNYDPTTSHINSSWIIYKKHGQDLIFIDKVDIDHHVYSLSELSSLLRKARWEPVAFYGSFSTLQPFSPLGSMNVVAKAK